MINTLKPYISLMRLNSISIVLLPLLPSLSSLILASDDHIIVVCYAILLIIGALIMRTAGGVINDIWDRNIDAQVTRTKNRPLANKQLTVHNALIILLILSITALFVLIITNLTTIIIGIICFIMTCLYPLAKRYVKYPQLILGITFNMGVLMGCSIIKGTVNLATILLYLGCVLWTIVYDTIYAYQDRLDDIKLGLHSTAIYFGNKSKFWLKNLYMFIIMLWLCVGALSHLNWWFYLSILVIAIIFYNHYKKSNFDNPEKCGYIFKNNIFVSLVLFMGILLGKFF